MREFTCVVCGAKAIDNSYTQNKKFCSERCRWRNQERKRGKPVELVCLYNDGVLCTNHQCGICGWNPAVEQVRKEKHFHNVDCT